MTEFSTSAPGKAVISGEYAVLHGAPAISMAVDCRARVNVVTPGGRDHSIRIAGSDPVPFRAGREGAIEWLDGRPHVEYHLFAQVWRHVQAEREENLVLTLDTRDFFDAASGVKLGLGSSAALAVAIAAALHDGHEEQAAATAAAAHLAFQGGQGSGLDIATAVHGGLIGFTRDEPVQKLQWPEGLRYYLFWCGRPSSTVDQLRKAEQAAHRDSSRRAMADLAKASAQVFDTWQRASDRDIVAAFEAYVAALRQYSDAGNLGIFDGGHGELCDIAAEYGLVYKPCGAGGGDIGIVLAPRAAATAEFSARAEGLDFMPLHCALESRGLNVERQDAT